MRKVTFAVLAALLLMTTVTACTPTSGALIDCLYRESVITVRQPVTRYPLSYDVIPDGSAIDARAATWNIDNQWPVSFSPDFEDVCFVGGTIRSPLGPGTTWVSWHGTSGMVVKGPSFELVETRFENVGDGIRFSGAGGSDWRLQGVRMDDAHDDCIENDTMHSGVVDDSFFNGCFVFYSARGAQGSNNDGGNNTVTITNSLVHLKPMTFPDLDDGDPVHGPPFKLSANPTYGRSPQMVIENTILRFDQEPRSGADLKIPDFDHDNNPDTPRVSFVDSCENNTIVWLGEGPFPGDFPSCFTITTDPAVWDDAVADWEALHPG